MHRSTYILLTLEPMSAVLARVAARLIVRAYSKAPGDWADPVLQTTLQARSLSANGFRTLGTWLSAYAYHMGRGMTVAQYKQLVVRRSRWAALNRSAGRPWARVPAR